MKSIERTDSGDFISFVGRSTSSLLHNKQPLLVFVHVGPSMLVFPILRIALDWSRTDESQVSSSVGYILEGFPISEPWLINLLEVLCRSTTRLGLRLECPWGIPVVHIGHDQR